MAPKGLAALKTVGVQITEDNSKERKYKAALKFYRKNPKILTEKAIMSFLPTTGIRTPSPATLAASGDETTWSCVCVERRRESSEGPPQRRLNGRI
jgi:hypothetical protein